MAATNKKRSLPITKNITHIPPVGDILRKDLQFNLFSL